MLKHKKILYNNVQREKTTHTKKADFRHSADETDEGTTALKLKTVSL